MSYLNRMKSKTHGFPFVSRRETIRNNQKQSSAFKIFDFNSCSNLRFEKHAFLIHPLMWFKASGSSESRVWYLYSPVISQLYSGISFSCVV